MTRFRTYKAEHLEAIRGELLHRCVPSHTSTREPGTRTIANTSASPSEVGYAARQCLVPVLILEGSLAKSRLPRSLNNFRILLKNLVQVGALAAAENRGRRAIAVKIPYKTKHGPGGRGESGPCDRDCVKCMAEAVLRETPR